MVGFALRQPGHHYGREPELLCELHLQYDDGTREIIGSDERWTRDDGPIVYSDLLMGERYDARRELGPWHPVAVRPLDDVRLVPERAQPIRVTEELAAGRRSPQRGPGVHIVDLGQNMVGWARLRVSRRAWHARAAALRRDARARRLPAPRQPPQRTPARHLRPRRRRHRGMGTTLHLPRLPLRRSHRHRRLRADRPRRALRHARLRRVRVLRRARQPTLAQHPLGPARQLPLRPHRLPATRRTARLARRRPGLPPHRHPQHGRRRLHHQMGRRHPRRAVPRAAPTRMWHHG